MNEELGVVDEGCCCVNEGLLCELQKWAGTTVTIYTESGGASGCGFTGVLITCSPCIVRLITCIGPGPCCSLGSTCNTCCCPTFSNCSCGNSGNRRSGSCGFNNFNSSAICSVGAIVDIPVERIVAFVHNAI